MCSKPPSPGIAQGRRKVLRLISLDHAVLLRNVNRYFVTSGGTASGFDATANQVFVHFGDQTFVAQQASDVFNIQATNHWAQAVVLVSRLSDDHAVLAIGLTNHTFDNQQLFGYTNPDTTEHVDFAVFGFRG